MSVDDRVSVVALIEGEPVVRAATVVHRDQTMLHVTTEQTLALPVGDVVGLMTHARADSPGDGPVGTAVALALVAESVGPNITALRVLERRS